jgi:hypothetical protein
MSTKFTEYKGLDLPTVASEVLDFLEVVVLKTTFGMDYRIHHVMAMPLRYFLQI